MKHWLSVHPEKYKKDLIGLKNSWCDIEAGKVDSPVEILYTTHMYNLFVVWIQVVIPKIVLSNFDGWAIVEYVLRGSTLYEHIHTIAKQ